MSPVMDAKPKKNHRIGRVLLSLTLTVLFALGIVALMMVLAGKFEPKVNVRSRPDVVEAPAKTVAFAEAAVKMVRLPRQESAVGTIRAVYEAVVASKLLAQG